jgi:unsaturated chondroitin disaccharide hydrolase
VVKSSIKGLIYVSELSTHTVSFADEAWAYSLEKIRHTLATITGFPEYTEGDHWFCTDDGGWTGAHWTGLLWLAYAHTGDNDLQIAARQWTNRLAPRQHDTSTHDLGFLFELSHILGANLTGDATLKLPAIQAAQTLTRRFNPKGGYIQAWGALYGTADQRGRTIVDALMNLNLLFWATKETGDPQFADIAVTTALTMLERHVRADGSTSHTTEFNPDTGAFIKQGTHQGLSSTSCWARGHSWAIYGFTVCYRETGDVLFLEAARKLAAYALNHQPFDHVPYWDYDSPLIPNDVRDSSAASILASALLLLASVEHELEQVNHWRSEAIIILQSLWDNYSSRASDEPSILIHGTQHKPRASMDHGLIYGDYYFVEALQRLGYTK